MTGLEQAALNEVADLHVLFTRWLGPGEGDLARAAAALAPEFRMVLPDGALVERAAVLAFLEAMRGRRGPAFRIEIAEAEAREAGQGHVLVTYVERQEDDGKATARRSSALFRFEPSAPCGVVWLHLHETWLGWAS
ncbi:DUF4440 domain-containing protein [Geminicoccus roseus]|uniref:DUF4440 domain-containing protein n=1 Tax=Geminicoccus roseus TaxID=404900 RepID=UPI00040308B7|nr:DUF4440 domain-containing protein [Geminicoccus roseus]